MPVKLPSSDWSKARAAFIRLLETDPVLRAAGVRIVQLTPDGCKDFHAQPTLGQCPRVKVWCAGAPAGWETEGQHGTPFEIAVEIATAGWDEPAFLDLWGSIVTAVYPGEPGTALREAKERIMNESRVLQVTMTQVPAAEFNPASGPILVGTGGFRLFLYVSTKE